MVEAPHRGDPSGSAPKPEPASFDMIRSRCVSTLRPSLLPSLLPTLLLLSAPLARLPASSEEAERAEPLVGPIRGLIAHVGCGDGALTAGLRVDEACLVHGIDRNPERIAAARERIRSLGLYGPVSVETWDQPFLPYVDASVNLLVVEDPGRVTEAEMMRVLVPGGTLRRRSASGWSSVVKPPDGRTDEWSHYRHSASGNPVSGDSLVGPPRHLQWTAGPGFTRAHEFTPSITSLVSSGGRIVYVADEGPVRTIRAPSSWRLVARDARNGLLLWKRALPDWFSRLALWTSIPRQLNRKLVADGDRVYVTLGFHAPVTALDAATGETRLEYPGTEGAEEIVCEDGTLVVVVRELTAERVEAYRELLRTTEQPDTPLAVRETRQPRLEAFRRVENRAPRAIVAFDAASGEERWRVRDEETLGLEPLTLCVQGGRVFCQRRSSPADRRRGRSRQEVAALDLETGKTVWAVPGGSLRLVCEAGAVCRSRERLLLLSREDGSALWSRPTTLVSARDIFAVGSSLWIGGFKPFDTGTRWTGPAWGPYFAVERDLATGEVRREVSTGNPGHHHRCYDSVATGRHLLTGRRGTEFIDVASGEVSYHSWARGTCRYGVMPANGLLYAPPHECGCYVVAKLIGFNALAASRSYDRALDPGGDDTPDARLERGPAHGRTSGKARDDDWPTFRGDAARSGSTRAVVPHRVGLRWRAPLGGPLSAPTVSGGRVLVAAPDRHEVMALDLATGEEAWRYTANGPVDSPPTAHAGLVLFGSRDGQVHALRAEDGKMAWRFRATRDPRRLVARGRLESPLPVPGSVLVTGGVLWCTAGRSSFLDGGIDLYRLDPDTGEVLSSRRIHSPDPDSGRQTDPLERRVIRGSRIDILTADGDRIFLQDRAFAADGTPDEGRFRHLFALTGFLDDEWVHRSYLVYGEIPATRLGSGGDRMQEVVRGRLLSVDGDTVYGYGRKSVHWSNELEDGPCRVFARDKETRKETYRWERPCPVRVRALVVTGDAVLVAGPPADESAGDDAAAPARLLALSKPKGERLAETPLPAPPVLHGMAAAAGHLVLTLESGEVVCLAAPLVRPSPGGLR